ncbi:MAG TPA: glycosyltransferase family 4 protein [Flavobacteriales bacterium]|nr:glycosyltransferase family 4 protein [Flavobacteriales bacterium]
MRTRKKVMYILSQIGDSKEFDLMADQWDSSRFELEIVLLHSDPDSNLQRHIRARGHTCLTIPYSGRISVISCFWRLYRHMRRSKPDVVNANLLEASFLGLISARLAGVPMAIYTRHHTTHNHKYHPVRGVLYDRICNFLAHRIIAISEVTREILVEKEGVKPEKIVLIHHGFDLSQPLLPNPEKGQELRHRYGLNGKGPIVGVISRPFEWKGLDHTIAAFAALVKEVPKAHLMLFNWHSTDQVERYEKLLGELPEGTWQTIWFENGILELYHHFDVFVHVPEDAHSEAFGFVYIEAMTTGTPSVFTRSGIMHETATQDLHGIRFVPFKDAGAILEAMRAWIAERPSKEQRAAWARSNTAELNERLGIARKLEALYELYATA